MALSSALASVAPWLQPLGVETIVLVTSNWRLPAFTLGDTLPPSHASFTLDHDLHAAIFEEGIALGLAMSQGPAPALPSLEGLTPAGVRALLPVSLAFASPERVTDLGFAINGGARQANRRVAVMAFGHLAQSSDEGAAQSFDAKVLDMLRDGLGGRLLDIAPDTWLSAKPDAELAHLFALLGAVGSETAGECLAYGREDGLSSAIVRFLPGEETMFVPPPEPSVIWLQPQGGAQGFKAADRHEDD